MGIISESRWAASVFTIPVCRIEAIKNKNITGNKTDSNTYINHGALLPTAVKSGLKIKKESSKATR